MAAPQEEIDRLDALACCRIIGTPPEPEFDALAKLAALLTDSSRAVITLVAAERVWVKAAHGFVPGGDYPRADAPCDVVIRERGVYELADLQTRFSEHALVAGSRAYAAVPLTVNGMALGTLAVFARAPRSLSAQQREHLAALGRQASALLELRRLREPRQLKREALRYTATRITGIGCWQWDLLSGEILLSDEMLRLFGVEPSHTFGYDEYMARVHPDDRQAVIANIELSSRGELAHFPDYRIIREDGQVRVVHATSEVERDEQGRPVRLTGALHDVTAQRAAEEQRKQVAMNAMQTQKLESLGVLSGGVAHDFNNLLVGVLGNAELALADRSLSPSTAELLERIIESAQRAGALTRQLLAYTGRSHLKFHEVDLCTQLSHLLERLRAMLPRDVALRAALPSGFPAVRADLDQLQLLTTNLVLNASESYEGSGEVDLRVFTVELDREEPHDICVPTPLGPGRYVVLEVADRGCGMARATLDRALEPFFTTKFTGRGLGLSAVQGIARSHSGVLTVDSTPGMGSRVRLYFPALALPAVPRQRSEPPNPQRGQLSGHTVLLVDDEQMVRNVERLAMQRAGLTVFEAEDGQMAIDVLRRNLDKIDVVVLDLMMPGLDSATTLKELRALRPHLPVIVQSGYSEEDAARSLEKVDDFLQKPFSVATMLAKVTSVLRGK